MRISWKVKKKLDVSLPPPPLFLSKLSCSGEWQGMKKFEERRKCSREEWKARLGRLSTEDYHAQPADRLTSASRSELKHSFLLWTMTTTGRKKKRKRKRQSREESHDTIYRHIALIREEECTVARVRKGGNSVRSGERRQTMLQCAFNIHAHTQSRLCMGVTSRWAITATGNSGEKQGQENVRNAS